MGCSLFLFRTPALGRLIKSKFAPDEFPSLIMTTFAREDAGDRILNLGKDDAQALIDVIDEVCSTQSWSYPAEFPPTQSVDHRSGTR